MTTTMKKTSTFAKVMTFFRFTSKRSSMPPAHQSRATAAKSSATMGGNSTMGGMSSVTMGSTMGGYNSNGPTAVPSDSLLLAHLRIRKDLSVFLTAVKKLVLQLQGSITLAEWQMYNLQKYFYMMYRLIDTVHTHEEEVLFPLIKAHSDAGIPMQKAQGMGTVRLLSNCLELVQGLQSGLEAGHYMEVLRDLKKYIAQLQHDLVPHMDEVDAQVWPRLKECCTPRELDACEAKLLHQPSPQDWAHFLKLLPDDKSKKAMMQRMSASKWTQTMVMMKECKKYDKGINRMINELLLGYEVDGGKNRKHRGQSEASNSGLGFGAF